VPVPQAAKFFVFVTLGGVTGKIVVTLLAPLTGRRWLGVIWGFGGVVALAAAGYYSNVIVGGLPAMVILLCASTFFIEGGFANFAPYTVERYGVRLGARASGLGQAANGVGKIVGPLSLALIAGSSNVVSPQATSDAVLPAYLFLAFCMLLVGLSFVFLAVETHGKAMGVGDEDRMIEPRGVALGAEPR
jgi:putative MFS transporter